MYTAGILRRLSEAAGTAAMSVLFEDFKRGSYSGEFKKLYRTRFVTEVRCPAFS